MVRRSVLSTAYLSDLTDAEWEPLQRYLPCHDAADRAPTRYAAPPTPSTTSCAPAAPGTTSPRTSILAGDVLPVSVCSSVGHLWTALPMPMPMCMRRLARERFGVRENDPSRYLCTILPTNGGPLDLLFCKPTCLLNGGILDGPATAIRSPANWHLPRDWALPSLPQRACFARCAISWAVGVTPRECACCARREHVPGVVLFGTR